MYIANCSLGKDSLAMLYLIKAYGYPLDVVYWADLGSGAEFDETYYFRKEVEAALGLRIIPVRSKKWSWDSIFYSHPVRGKTESIRGFPPTVGPGCRYRSWLKTDPLKEMQRKGDTIYIGIACDEAHRAEAKQYSEDKNNTYVFPLIELEYTEADCRKLCAENNILNPLYRKFRRLGCWGCPKQPITSLRILRREYPGYWSALLKMQKDCPWPYSASGTMEELEEKFRMEEENIEPENTLLFKEDSYAYGFFFPANSKVPIRPDDTPWADKGRFYLLNLGDNVDLLLAAENVQEIGYGKYEFIEGDYIDVNLL